MHAKSTWLTGVAAVVMLSVGAPASAQIWGGWGRDRDRDRTWDRGDVSRMAYDNGYRRGLERGERDGRDRRAMNYRDERDYRDADWGYNSRYGSRGQYRQAFRDGYERGYVAGYNRYARGGGYGRAVPRQGYPDYGRYPAPNDRYGYPNGRYGGGYGYGYEAAFENGYRDGIEKGEKDWRDRRSHDMLRHDWYRDGDRHYRREYGNRDEYKRSYREGFKQGYDQAFRGGRW